MHFINHRDKMSMKCIHPFTPLLYSKTGEYRGKRIFVIFASKIDCGYSLEPPRSGGSNVYPQCMF